MVCILHSSSRQPLWVSIYLPLVGIGVSNQIMPSTIHTNFTNSDYSKNKNRMEIEIEISFILFNIFHQSGH